MLQNLVLNKYLENEVISWFNFYSKSVIVSLRLAICILHYVRKIKKEIVVNTVNHLFLPTNAQSPGFSIHLVAVCNIKGRLAFEHHQQISHNNSFSKSHCKNSGQQNEKLKIKA
jgi:hypothetical protein